MGFTAGIVSLDERLHLEDHFTRRAGNKYLRSYSTVASIYKLVYFIAESKEILFTIAITNLTAGCCSKISLHAKARMNSDTFTIVFWKAIPLCNSASFVAEQI